ncbi:MAG: stress response kinase A, partial [Morganella morganii]
DILLDAYQEFCDFDTRELALIEPLRAMRMVHFLSWVARRWQDPAFPRAFPWMAEGDFWSQQQSLMTEQTAVLAEPPLTRFLPY